MKSKSLFAFLSALALSSASPLRRRCSNTTVPITPTNPGPAPPAVTTPTLPTTGSGTQLAGPGNSTLKRILVGHGIQNYTCASAGATAASIGALAVVWDITSLSTSLPTADFDALPSKVLRTTSMPLNLAADGSGGADPTSPFPAPADLTVNGVRGAESLKFMGHHFFDTANTPTFDLTGAGDGELFKGKKDAGISAPADADAGENPTTGAVDWLRLSDKGTSNGVSLVYRVLTAGGNPEACTEAGQSQSIPYAAQYWVYTN